VVEDFDYEGVPFRKGDMLMLHLPAQQHAGMVFAMDKLPLRWDL